MRLDIAAAALLLLQVSAKAQDNTVPPVVDANVAVVNENVAPLPTDDNQAKGGNSVDDQNANMPDKQPDDSIQKVPVKYADNSCSDDKKLIIEEEMTFAYRVAQETAADVQYDGWYDVSLMQPLAPFSYMRSHVLGSTSSTLIYVAMPILPPRSRPGSSASLRVSPPHSLCISACGRRSLCIPERC